MTRWACPSPALAHGGLQEKMVHDGRQEAHVLQRSSGTEARRASKPQNMILLHEDETCAVQSDRTCVSPLVPLQDAYARGEVFLGCKENSYTVLPGLPQNVQGHHWPFGITIGTPDRKFLFACETEEDQKDWIAALQSVIDRPMQPQEYAGESRAFGFSSLFTWGLNMFFLQFSLQWRHISSANREPLSVFEELPVPIEEQGMSCNERERDPSIQ